MPGGLWSVLDEQAQPVPLVGARDAGAVVVGLEPDRVDVPQPAAYCGAGETT